MRDFDDILNIVRDRKGDETVARLTTPLASPAATAPDDRWLSTFTRAIFQAGFNWKVIEAKWPGFEEAFDGFDIGRCAMMSDERFDALLKDTRIVRYAAKIKSVQDNAIFLSDLAKKHGSAGAVFATWLNTDFVGLLTLLKKDGARLGGTTGQYALRFMEVDSFILSRDVTARLVAEGVVDKSPTSAKAMASVQEAFNTWMCQSGLGLTQISRVLAQSIG